MRPLNLIQPYGSLLRLMLPAIALYVRDLARRHIKVEEDDLVSVDDRVNMLNVKFVLSLDLPAATGADAICNHPPLTAERTVDLLERVVLELKVHDETDYPLNVKLRATHRARLCVEINLDPAVGTLDGDVGKLFGLCRSL
jgi:hypothetical protein